MSKAYRIELDDLDLGQLLDGLEVRAAAWEKTAFYLRHERLPNDERFIIEECSDPDEAERIASHYRSIIAKILTQRQAQ